MHEHDVFNDVFNGAHTSTWRLLTASVSAISLPTLSGVPYVRQFRLLYYIDYFHASSTTISFKDNAVIGFCLTLPLTTAAAALGQLSWSAFYNARWKSKGPACVRLCSVSVNNTKKTVVNEKIRLTEKFIALFFRVVVSGRNSFYSELSMSLFRAGDISDSN